MSLSREEILDRLVALPVSTWNYTTEDAGARHMGPMAQDFHAAFGLGDTDRTIHVVDAIGVLIVAVQELASRVQTLEQELCHDPG